MPTIISNGMRKGIGLQNVYMMVCIGAKCRLCRHHTGKGDRMTLDAFTEITYQMCANTLLEMWMDDVLTDGEYNHIMDKLNAWERNLREGRQDNGLD